MIKSIDQLAKAAYEAYLKKAVEEDEEGLVVYAESWEQLDPGTQACWIAVTTQLWAEFAAIR